MKKNVYKNLIDLMKKDGFITVQDNGFGEMEIFNHFIYLRIPYMEYIEHFFNIDPHTFPVLKAKQAYKTKKQYRKKERRTVGYIPYNERAEDFIPAGNCFDIEILPFIYTGENTKAGNKYPECNVIKAEVKDYKKYLMTVNKKALSAMLKIFDIERDFILAGDSNTDPLLFHKPGYDIIGFICPTLSIRKFDPDIINALMGE